MFYWVTIKLIIPLDITLRCTTHTFPHGWIRAVSAVDKKIGKPEQDTLVAR